MTELAVKPRKLAGPDDRPVVAIAVHDGYALDEHGQRFDLHTFIEHLPDHGPAILVTDDDYQLLALADEYWSHHSHWQWKLHPPEHAWSDDEPAGRTYQRPTVSRLGFGRYGQNRRSRYFQIVCPGRFVAEGLDVTGCRDMLTFGVQLRAWARSQGMLTPSTAAGIGSRMLTDPRFEPEPRRKVPAATNARAREQLPANHYQLLADPARMYDRVRQLDISRAHHRAAICTRFPDPNTLRARGRWRHADRYPDGSDADDWHARPYAWRADHPQFASELRRPGLLLLALRVPDLPADLTRSIVHPLLARPGLVYRHVHSNELDYLRAAGVRVLAIVAAWTSAGVSEHLNEYGWWAIEHLDNAPVEVQGWLKPALLATYGLLAARPRPFKVAYRTATKGKARVYMGPQGQELLGRERQTAPREPRTANVIARGLIEAQVRLWVIVAAERLRRRGKRVLAVWADGVFIHGDADDALQAVGAGDLTGWRDEGVLTRCRFYDSSHIAADGVVKLPGITGGQREQYASLAMREGRAARA